MLLAHSQTSQANMLHCDQKIAKCIACSRLSDSGEDAKEEGTQKDGGTEKKKKEKKPFSPVFSLFSCSRFLNSADPTISEPGQAVRPLALYSQTVTRKPVD